jgi:hypothetical protein
MRSGSLEGRNSSLAARSSTIGETFAGNSVTAAVEESKVEGRWRGAAGMGEVVFMRCMFVVHQKLAGRSNGTRSFLGLYGWDYTGRWAGIKKPAKFAIVLFADHMDACSHMDEHFGPAFAFD